MPLQVYSGRASKERAKANATKHISFAPEAPCEMGKPIPAVYGGSPQQQRGKPPPHVMDYTVKAGVRPSSQVSTSSWHVKYLEKRRALRGDVGVLPEHCLQE